MYRKKNPMFFTAAAVLLALVAATSFFVLCGSALKIWHIALIILAALATLAALIFDTKVIGYQREQIGVLKMSSEAYRIAARQSEKYVVRYDVKTKKLYRPDSSDELIGRLMAVDNVPYSTISNGHVAAESVEQLSDFFDKMARGVPYAEADFLMKTEQTGDMLWYHGEYTLFYDSENAPSYAIISFCDNTENREKQINYQRYLQYARQLGMDNTMLCEYNLTQDYIEHTEGKLFSGDETKAVASGGFNAAAEKWARETVCAEDEDRYLSFANRDRLLAMFSSGICDDTMEYRARTQNSERWTRARIRLFEYPGSSDVKAYVLHTDIHEEKTCEMQLHKLSSQDSLTGVSNRKAFEDEVSALLSNMPDSQHALIMIDLDNFKSINDRFGHVEGDRVLVETARALKLALCEGDVLGRMGGDEFMICLSNVTDNEELSRRAQIVCELMRTDLRDGTEVSGSLGVAVYPRDGDNFPTLYENADKAVYNAKRCGKNRIGFFGSDLKNTQSESASAIDGLCIASVSDNSKNRQARELLERNERLIARRREDERHRIIMENAGAITFEINFKTGEFFAAEGFLQYEFLRAEPFSVFTGRVDASGIHPLDVGLFKKEFAGKLACGKAPCETELRFKLVGGGYVWRRLSVACLRDEGGAIVRLVGAISKDTTEERRSDSGFKYAGSYMPAGVVAFEYAGTVEPIYVSDSFYRMSPEIDFTFDGTVDIFARIAPEDAELLRRGLKKAAENGDLLDCVVSGAASGRKYHIRAVCIPCEGSNMPTLVAVILPVVP